MDFVSLMRYDYNDLLFNIYSTGMILVLTVQAVVQIRQKYQRFVNQSPEPGFGILFDDIRRKDADLSLVQCIKFLLNYGFYKFGVEVRYSYNRVQ